MEPEQDRLESWKEIAAHFGRDLRTVQRWEKSEGLPVRRHQHGKQGSVFAYVSELEAWRSSRERRGIPEQAPSPEEKVQPLLEQADRKSRPVWIGIVLCGGLLAAAWIIWFMRAPSQTWDAALVPRPLTSNPGDEVAPAFSPDGKQLAFSWNGAREDNYDIYVTVLGSNQVRRLTTSPDAEYSPVWSPDGRSIAFLRGRDGGYCTLMIVPASGGSPRRVADTLSPTLPQGRALDWSPDGKWIAVEDSETPEAWLSVYLVSVENGEKRKLIAQPERTADLQPAFSPNGREIAFTRDIGRGVSIVEVLTLSPDLRAEGPPRAVRLPGFENVIVSYPRWLPDGKNLIVSSNRGGTDRLWQVSVSGTEEPRLLGSFGDLVSYPVLSANGRELAFSRIVEDTNIWAVPGNRPDGQPVKLISSTRVDESPSFSPDGTRIAFHSTRSGSSEIWTAARDGSNARPLTKILGPLAGSPRWSPDGQSIVFDSRLAGQPDIYVIAANGGPLRRLTDDPAADVLPSWSADGKWIYFCSNRTGTRQIWRVPAAGGKAQQITHKGGFASAAGPDGKMVYYTRERERVTSLWQAPGEGGTETMVLDGVAERSFAVAGRRIYFLAAHPIKDAFTLRYLDPETGKTVSLKQLTGIIEPGLAVSPDGDTVLLTQLDAHGSNIMVAGVAP